MNTAVTSARRSSLGPRETRRTLRWLIAACLLPVLLVTLALVGAGLGLRASDARAHALLSARSLALAVQDGQRLDGVVSPNAVPAGWVLSVVDRSARLVLRLGADARVGELVAPALREALLEGKSEGVLDYVNVDGSSVVAAYARTRDGRVVVVAASAMRLMLDLLPQAALAAGACLGGVLISMWIARRHVGRLVARAYRDPLTGLADRALFLELAEGALRQAQRSAGSVAVLALDLDGFKTVNDILGHAAGDGVLREVARRLHRTLRESDILARMGGDEFVVLLVNCTNRQLVAQRVIDALGQPYDQARGIAVGASAGLAVHAGESLELLLRRADLALHDAKSQGKGRVRGDL